MVWSSPYSSTVIQFLPAGDVRGKKAMTIKLLAPKCIFVIFIVFFSVHYRKI